MAIIVPFDSGQEITGPYTISLDDESVILEELMVVTSPELPPARPDASAPAAADEVDQAELQYDVGSVDTQYDVGPVLVQYDVGPVVVQYDMSPPSFVAVVSTPGALTMGVELAKVESILVVE